VSAVEGEGGWTPPPDWPEQFKSPEDVLKAYNELRPEMNRVQSQLAQMEEQHNRERQQWLEANERLATRGTELPAGQQQFDPLIATFARAAEEGDYVTMARASADLSARGTVDAVAKLLEERLAPLSPALEETQRHQREANLRMAEDVVQRTLGPERYQALFPTISATLQENGHWLPQGVGTVDGFTQAILTAAKLAETETKDKRISELEAELAEKRAAQTLTGGGVRSAFTTDEQQAEWQRIKDAPTGSYSEMMARARGAAA
jgi:hypothetical protein